MIVAWRLQGGGFMDMFGMMEEMMGNVVSTVPFHITRVSLIFPIKHAFKQQILV